MFLIDIWGNKLHHQSFQALPNEGLMYLAAAGGLFSFFFFISPIAASTESPSRQSNEWPILALTST